MNLFLLTNLLFYAIVSKFGKYLLYSVILIIYWVALSKIAKLPVFINKIIDDVTVIELSVQMLEMRNKKTLDDESRVYIQQIRNRCNIIAKSIYDDFDKFSSKN